MALESSLEEESYIVRTESTGRDAERVLEEFAPDLAILDVHLPGGPDGYTVARRLRAASRIPILFLTGADTVDDRLAGFAAGGDDYLVKPFSMAELLARIRAILLRTGSLSTARWEIGDLVVDEARRKVTRAGHPIDLTPTEYQLLSVLVKNTGQVVSKDQIVGHVWGFDPVESNAINVHMSSLRRKLDAHGPHLIHTVRGMGFVLRA
jgi:two-component system, OmpR family, response regulator